MSERIWKLVEGILGGAVLPEWVGPGIVVEYLRGATSEDELLHYSVLLRKASAFDAFVRTLAFGRRGPESLRAFWEAFLGYPYTSSFHREEVRNAITHIVLLPKLEEQMEAFARLAAREFDLVWVFRAVVERLEREGLIEAGAVSTV